MLTKSWTISARSDSRKPAAGQGCTSMCESRPNMAFNDVRRAALAFAREVERRAPQRSPPPGGARTAIPRIYSWTTTRTLGITPLRRRTPFGALRTPASRRRCIGTRSTTPTRMTSRSSPFPQRFAALGDLHADIDARVFDIAPFLEWADRDERDGEETPDEED